MVGSFPCLYCSKVCRSAGGLTQHQNAHHPVLSPDSDSGSDARTTTIYHSKLNGTFTSHVLCVPEAHMSPSSPARPVDQDGKFLPPHMKPMPRQKLDPSHPYDAFPDRLAFDWAHYHFIECASSKAKINRGLDLWLAAKVQATGNTNCAGLPWASADEMYATIDEIQAGNAPFHLVEFRYDGPLPKNPPAWMMQTYELHVRDVRDSIRIMLDTPAFESQFNPTPYRQFYTKSRDRVWSNLLSGDWAWDEAVCACMFTWHCLSY